MPKKRPTTIIADLMNRGLQRLTILRTLCALAVTCGLSLGVFIWFWHQDDACTHLLAIGAIDDAKVIEYVSSGKGFKSRHIVISYGYIVANTQYIGRTFFCSFPYDKLPQSDAGWAAGAELVRGLTKGAEVGVWVSANNPANSCLSADRSIALTDFSTYAGRCWART